MDSAEIAKISAISKNLEKKRRGRGNPALLINSFAEQLANREVTLNAADESDLFEMIDRIISGEPAQDNSTIQVVGTRGGKRKDGQAISWYRNLVFIWQAGVIIDFRNDRLFDFQSGSVFDFGKKKAMKMSDDKITDFLKVFRGARDAGKEDK